MSDIIKKYETLKKRKSGTILLTMSQFEELMRHIENTDWDAEENPHPAYEYQGDKVALHLWGYNLGK